MLRIVLIVLLALPGISEAQAPARPRQEGPGPRGGARVQLRPERLTAVVSGRIVDGGTGAPVRRAQVQAMSDEDIRIASTDDEGRFELRDLTAGAWRVTASKSGYFPWQFGQRRPFEIPPPVVLAAGQRVTADIRITRGGAITGHVYDEYGEAVTAAYVGVLRARMSYGRRRLERVGENDLTDDTGRFRVHGLPPGEYYVTASLRVAPLDSVIGTTYAPTYFPGTGNVAEAQRISLELGAEANADFQVLPVRPVRVSGTVLNSSGAPADAFLNLVSDASELGIPLGLGGATRPDGSFTLPDVSPGLYTLNAMLRDGGASESTAIPLTVGSEDVTAITLVTAKAAAMRGTLVRDEGVTRTLPRGLGVSARGARPGGSTTQGTLSGNTFQLDDLDGPFLLEVEGVPDDWTVKSITVNGVDATDAPVDLKGQQGVVAHIVLTDRITDVIGVVAPETAQNGSIVIFAEDSSKWTYRSRFVRTIRADDRGRFRVAGLPPNERYLAVAVDYLEDEEGDDPDFLAKMKDHATSFTPIAGDQTTVDLTLVQR